MADKAISITQGILALYDISEDVEPYISAATTATSKKRGRRKKAQLRNEYQGIVNKFLLDARSNFFEKIAEDSSILPNALETWCAFLNEVYLNHQVSSDYYEDDPLKIDRQTQDDIIDTILDFIGKVYSTDNKMGLSKFKNHYSEILSSYFTDTDISKNKYKKYKKQKNKNKKESNKKEDSPFELFYELLNLLDSDSKKGESGVNYIISRSVSLLLKKYIYANGTNSKKALNFEELIAVYCLYLHYIDTFRKTSLKLESDNTKAFKQVLDMFTSYCSKDSGYYKSKALDFFNTPNYSSWNDSDMSLFQPTISLFITYYLLSDKLILNKFCSAAGITCDSSLVNNSIDCRHMNNSQLRLFTDIYNAIEYEFKFFPRLKETIEQHPNEIIKIDKFSKDRDKKTACEKIALLIANIIESAEGVHIPIPLDIIENENIKNAGEEYVLNIVKEIEMRLLSACKENLFCKTFVDRGNIKAIKQYVLLNTKQSGNKYIIQNNLTAVYNRVIDLLESYVTSESYVTTWDYRIGQPPTVKDLVDDLSLLADYLLAQAMEKADTDNLSNAQRRESARLWCWEDIPYALKKNQRVFEMSGIIRKSIEKNGMVEFENQCYRLILAALGYVKNHTQVSLDYIDQFLDYYSEEATDQTQSHLEYHMDDASVYLCMLLLASPTRENVIREMCTSAKKSISPELRVKQEAYIFCLSLLLVQTQYHATSQERDNIFALYKSNIYHYQINAYRDLTSKDPSFAAYAKRTFEQSLICNEETGWKSEPPYYIYLMSLSAISLIGEKYYFEPYSDGMLKISFNVDMTIKQGPNKIFNAFLRMQHLTWSKLNGYQVKLEEECIGTLLKWVQEYFEKQLDAISDAEKKGIKYVPSSELFKMTYGFQTFLMALSNIERATPGAISNWIETTQNSLWICLIYSEYFQRKFNRFYNKDDMKKGNFWMQCGGYRYIASLNNNISLVRLENRYLELMYSVFSDALKLEQRLRTWRFYYMLLRMLNYSNFFAYDKYWRITNKKAELKIPKLPLDKFNTTFMQYDNMEKWMKDNDYLC